MKTIVTSVTSAVGVLSSSNILINIFLAGGLSQILSSVQQLVIIVHVFLINLAYPMTSQVFFAALMQIATFQFYNFTDTYNRAFHLDDNGNVPLNPLFNTMGYNALYMIQNFGALCPTILILPVLWFSILLLYFCVSKQRFGAVWNKINNMMFFNYWIGFINETYIFLGVCASLNAIYYNRFDTTGNVLFTVLSILICAVILLFPVYIKIFFSLKRN